VGWVRKTSQGEPSRRTVVLSWSSAVVVAAT